MEFGSPHLEIREPIQVGADRTERVRRSLARRRVTPTGAWHFWIMHCHWTLKTSGGSADDAEIDRPKVDAMLADLDGQRLIAVSDTVSPSGLRLIYDLGGVLDITPNPEAEDDEDQWALHKEDGVIWICNHAGALRVERSDVK